MIRTLIPISGVYRAVYGTVEDLISFAIDYIKTRIKLKVRTNYIDSIEVSNRVNFTINDIYSLKGKYGIDNQNLINLSGGLPIRTFINCQFIGNSIDEDLFKVEILYHLDNDKYGNKQFGRIKRTIDFQRRTIRNEEIQLQVKGLRIGTNVFINQVNEARKLSFNLFLTNAAGGSDYWPLTNWDGYKVWVKYGYMMNKYYQKKYDLWRKTFGLKEKTLNELYTKKTNYHLWEMHGFSWEGMFDLTDKSNSIKYLKKYLISKHINLKLSPFGPP